MFSKRFPIRLGRNTCAYSDFVKVVEVGPRDGLQNEKKIIPTSVKVDLINRLSETGLKVIEVTSFVSPKWIPQMADQKEVFQEIKKYPTVSYPVLVPNAKGLETAIEVGAKEIAIFGSASEAFSQKNTNCSIKDGIKRFKVVADQAKAQGIRIRGYVSCVVGCPYEGHIKPINTLMVTERMLDLGCYEVSLGDTIGVGTPKNVGTLLYELRNLDRDLRKFSLHCHDTYGQAIANIYVGLQSGIRTFDSSVAGLGGCPYAAGASGNVATEDLLYLLQGENLETGVNLEKVVNVGDFICTELGRSNGSKVGAAISAKKKLVKK